MAQDFHAVQSAYVDALRHSMQSPALTHGGTAPLGLPAAAPTTAGAHPAIYDPANMAMNLAMSSGALGPDGQDPGHGAPGGAGAPAGGAQSIYDALLAAGPDWSDKILAENKDKLLSGVIPAAEATWGDSRIMAALQSNWMKAIYAALSAVTGKPYYDRSDPTHASLFYVPGYAPSGAAGSIDPTNDPSHSWYT